ncbi:phage holin family protein [Cytobacillus depressus]|uniref:Phage holin family protein n=1 Tax=Cytobacillus depressus TaxID=1602942 RepID=A0A6L3V6G4_9BACI|nr:phage holin family protein [Cytobacillus depressus]KAB2336836.1 phage holin family protein [Cytobacillus depressus]
MYPKVLDINNQLVAVLDTAYKIGYTKIKNNLWTCQFTMVLKDKKNVYIKPKYFIELYDHDRYIGKFIVNPKRTIKNESTNEITFQCEHVLSLLHSDVFFRYHQFSNFITKDFRRINAIALCVLELISIAENGVKIGAAIPRFIVNILSSAKDKTKEG